MNFYKVFFWCSSGQHYVRHGTEVVRDSDGKKLCPTHLKALRTKGRLYGRRRKHVSL